MLIAVGRRAEQRRLQEDAMTAKKAEAAEAEKLRNERERLRNRFKDGSLDAEGVDPLAEGRGAGDHIFLRLIPAIPHNFIL